MTAFPGGGVVLLAAPWVVLSEALLAAGFVVCAVALLAALRWGRRRAYGLLDAAAEGACELDPAGCIVFANQRFATLLGYRVDELVGRRIVGFMAAPEREAAAGKAARRDFERAERFDWRFERRDGSAAWLQIATTPLTRRGRSTGILLLATDISDRKHAEAALLRSEESYRTVVEGASDAIWLLERRPGDGMFAATFVNPAYLELFGLTREEVRGKSARELFAPGAAEFILEQVALAVSRHLPVSYERVVEREGVRRNVLIRLTPQPNADGTVDRIVCTGRDMTEQHRQAELEAESRRSKAMAVLAGGIAHEFNNLLTAIRGNAGLALLQIGPASPVRPALEEIDRAGDRAATLVGQMLAYTGEGTLTFLPADLNRAVQAAIDGTPVPEGAVFSRHLASGLPAIEADPEQIRQAVANPLLNAFEAVGAGGRVSIATGLRAVCASAGDLPGGDYVFVEVTDDGPGMDAETREHVFDPFYTTKFAGRGLGLAAAMGIARGHGGTILLDSGPGRGTRVTILFPTARHYGWAEERRPAPQR